MTVVNIAQALTDRAQEQPETIALRLPTGREPSGRWQYRTLTYRQLETLSNELAARLRTAGIGPGKRAVLMVPPSLEFFALTFALFKTGAVSVFVDPGMGLANIGKCLAEAEPHAFLGIPKAHVARRLFGWAARSLTHWIAVGPGSGWARLVGPRIVPWRVEIPEEPGDGPPLTIKTRDSDLAAILFTSGSTGVPKGAVYTHGNFVAQVEMLRKAFQIQPGEVDLCTFPLFGLFAPALGMSAVIPRMNFTRPAAVEPEEIAGPIAQHGVSNLFGSPALLNRVGRHYGASSETWPSLQRVLSAGAPVAPPILERIARRLNPDAQIYTPYGATEALPVAVIGSREVLQETQHRTAQGGGTCVGRP